MTPTSPFSPRAGFTPLPNPFLYHTLPQIEDLVELKVCLHLFRLLYHKRGYPRYVTFGELVSDEALMACLAIEGDRQGTLRRCLATAVERGTVFCLELKTEGQKETQRLYFLNTETDKRAMERIKSGDISVAGISSVSEPPPPPVPQPNIFRLYEENIGLLTPLMAEELREAEERYPLPWIEEAFKEAVALNHRRWRYIASILERWATEGRGDGETGRHPQKTDTEKYTQGKYGHVARR
ncbi:MAG: DnaD domain protein [Chloroflexi bacterium]|nr:DnaD domain protein [Chloroflexota bacterium]